MLSRQFSNSNCKHVTASIQSATADSNEGAHGEKQEESAATEELG